MSDTSKVAGEIIARQERLHEAAEGILRELVAGGFASADDDIIFRELGWDERRVNAEVDRVRLARNSLAVAGGPAAIKTSEKRLAKITSDNAAAKPALQQQIAELQDRLAEMERLEREAQADVNRRTLARDRLKHYAPAHVKLAAQRIRHNAKSMHGGRVAELEQRIKTIDAVLKLSLQDDVEQILLHCGSFPSDHPAAPVVVDGEKVVPQFGWDTYMQELRSERLTAAAELERLLPELQGDLNAAEELQLAYYWDRVDESKPVSDEFDGAQPTRFRRVG